MYEQPPLETWLIISMENDGKYVKSLIQSLKDAVTTYNYFTKEPKIVQFKRD
jgi:hypothetical protein